MNSLSDPSTAAESTDLNLPSKHIIDILFDFLRTDEEWNPVLCGYFVKLLSSMQNQHRKEFNLFIYNPKNEIISSFVKHIYNKSLSDFLIKILNQDVMRSDYKNEVVEFIIINDDLKRELLMSVLD